MSTDLILSGIQQGLLLTLVAYGVMIPFRLLNFPDLTAEGAYPLGGAVCAMLLISGTSPIIAVILSASLSGLLGLGTGLIHLKFKVNTLLAGIIVSTMIYSVNLRIMGKPNIPLFNISFVLGNYSLGLQLFLVLSLIIILMLILALYLQTEYGLRLRAVGQNSEFSKRQGISISHYTLFGLFVANCLTGLAGALIVQTQHYMDISMGVGIVIHALAALMIGESIIGNQTLGKQLLAPLCGALVYQQIQGLALFMGLAPSDLKILTGTIVLSVIGLQRRTCHAA